MNGRLVSHSLGRPFLRKLNGRFCFPEHMTDRTADLQTLLDGGSPDRKADREEDFLWSQVAARPALMARLEAAEGAAAEDVAVEMGDGFPAVAAVVQHEPVAGIGEAELARDLGRLEEQMTEQGLVVRPGKTDAGDGFLGHDEDVDRRLRLDVVEDDALVVLVLDLRALRRRQNWRDR